MDISNTQARFLALTKAYSGKDGDYFVFSLPFEQVERYFPDFLQCYSKEGKIYKDKLDVYVNNKGIIELCEQYDEEGAVSIDVPCPKIEPELKEEIIKFMRDEIELTLPAMRKGEER